MHSADDQPGGDFNALMALAQRYFAGLYHADRSLLAEIFHRQAQLSAPGLRLQRDEWLDRVVQRPIPAQRGDAFGFSVHAIEVIGEMALIAVHCPLLGHNYFDFLSCLKEGDEWRIVHKLYADIPALSQQTAH